MHGVGEAWPEFRRQIFFNWNLICILMNSIRMMTLFRGQDYKVIEFWHSDDSCVGLTIQVHADQVGFVRIKVTFWSMLIFSQACRRLLRFESFLSWLYRLFYQRMTWWSLERGSVSVFFSLVSAILVVSVSIRIIWRGGVVLRKSTCTSRVCVRT